MTYSFTEQLMEQGNRYFIRIPFNVWEECGHKGLIPVEVCVQEIKFECKLVPKGNGVYYIPIAKSVGKQMSGSGEINLSFTVLQGLTRINHDSPYSVEHPIRKIDTIQRLPYPKEGYCGQVCIAMLTGLGVEEITELMQAKAWQCSFSKLIETLDYFGIAHDEKITYTRGKETVLPECCIVHAKGEPMSHFALYFHGKYYDSTDFRADQIIGYLRILLA